MLPLLVAKLRPWLPPDTARFAVAPILTTLFASNVIFLSVPVPFLNAPILNILDVAVQSNPPHSPSDASVYELYTRNTCGLVELYCCNILAEAAYSVALLFMVADSPSEPLPPSAICQLVPSETKLTPCPL